MTRVEPFGKVAERFASQQETRFSVRFPQAFITNLFQAFLKLISGFPQTCFMPFQRLLRAPPPADKIERPSLLRSHTPSQKGLPPFFSPSSKPYSYRGVQPPFFPSSSDVILVLS
ncbi:hypothetical protein AVEN_55171-1 [Araneus ventricosus]|uniref:Uncharacterized protein n=1 Tax=Araneus ventricosus TaxID=182803 RepID=A0A4Y2HII1_ARAVE|nr:hypothetical protein AVEN_248125-1 [Araneus ventricosus]GBM65143.1 hypothetical protein AVEN_55171-1 [Araneus ventricosus]